MCNCVLCVVAVSVVNDQWCWKSKSVDIEVVDRDLMSVDFTQTGFMLSASLSHSILLVRIICCECCLMQSCMDIFKCN